MFKLHSRLRIPFYLFYYFFEKIPRPPGSEHKVRTISFISFISAGTWNDKDMLMSLT